MSWIGRTLVVLGAMTLIVVGVPRLSELLGFLLFAVCVIVTSIALAPVLSRFTATALVDFIYSAHGTTAETDINDPEIYAQSQNVFSLLRTISFLSLAAALYGFYWSVPILRQWPPIQELTEMPRHMVGACVVAALSTAAWIFYLSVYFIPTVWNNLYERWINWRYREPS